MPKGTVLVVDDEEDVRELVGGSLANRGYGVVLARSGEEGLAKALGENPDVIVLDVEMPDMDGIQTCQEIRKHLLVPIIFLSTRSDETDIVLGLGVGGDNYLTKPFKIPELVAHVEAAMRRETLYSQRRKETRLVAVKDLVVDLAAHELRQAGNTIPVSVTEFKLIQMLVENVDRVLTRDQLLDRVWETKADNIYSRTVDVHIGRVRRKIGDDPNHPRYIVTVPGLGYKISST